MSIVLLSRITGEACTTDQENPSPLYVAVFQMLRILRRQLVQAEGSIGNYCHSISITILHFDPFRFLLMPVVLKGSCSLTTKMTK